MNEMAGWVWPLVAVVVGLALGIMLGAVRQRGRGASAPARETGPDSALPAGTSGEGNGSGRESTPQQRLLERLRAANLQLSSQLKSLAEANSRQQQEREQERQSERLRQERELEELRQQHANELSHLMENLVEQVDGLNKAHAEQVKALESEIERYRQEGRRAASSAPGALASGGSTRHGGAGGNAPAPAPSTRSGATPSDYSVTLPMESYKDHR
jgi:septal ring factor EnvC (AmiA/AmiB activator)